MHLEDVRETAKLRLPVMNGRKAQVIRIVPEQILTEQNMQPKAEAGFVVSDTERDILKLAVWERHGSNVWNTGVARYGALVCSAVLWLRL